MALLPHSLGARLEIDHSSLSGALILEAGAPLVEPGVSMNIPGGSFTLGVRWSEARSSQEPSGIGEIVEMLASALTKAEERRKLRDEAETDPLTGIGNRRRALRALSEAINHAEYADDCLSIFYLDLDFFKKVNDDLGHEVGDEVLVRFAQHLQVSVGERDTVARFGGEEFLVICPGLSQSTAVALLRFLVESTPAACAVALPVGWKQTASAGLACYPAAATHPDALIRCADQALYTAKSSGRNQFKVAGTSSTPTGRR
jgi:diguanylate cyclase (GGDEF)-like protein